MRNRIVALHFLLFFFLSLLNAQEIPANSTAQEGKALSSLSNSTTRAVVVGISDYQDPAIPDLRFAHRDAEAFASWLRSSAGGAVPEENIQLLINEKATIAQVSLALIDWLIEETKEGDRAIIYFSGHGEMETKLLNQLGYLLLWDSPAHISLAGALPVDILKQVVTTLSVEKKANVLVLADACRAGKLAAGDIIGAQLTNANLIKQFANEQKILSCQADEYSVEGVQWGGGRGAFSWHLVNGLYGLADLNDDRQITLLEIERFIQDHVSTEVQPFSQIPLAIGDKKVALANVYEELLTHVKQGSELPFTNFSGIEQRGLVQETMAKSDSSIVRLFYAFQQALKEKLFLEPAGNCAEDYYNRLMQEASTKPLHNYLRRNYAAALMDEGQQFLNKFLKNDAWTLDSIRLGKFRYNVYAAQTNRAAELLGEYHYIYKNLKAKTLFFQAWASSVGKTRVPPDSIQAVNQRLLRQATLLEPDAPYLWMRLSLWAPKDSLEFYHRKITGLAPNWAYWYISMGSRYGNEPEKSVPYYQKALELDSNNLIPYNAIALHYHRLGRPEEAQKYEEALVALGLKKWKQNPMSLTVIDELQSLAVALWRLKRYSEAEAMFKEMLSRSDKKNITPFYHLILICIDMGKFDEAIRYFETSKQYVFPTPLYLVTGEAYHFYLNDPKNAESHYRNALTDSVSSSSLPEKYVVYFRLSTLYRQTGDLSKALDAIHHCTWKSPNVLFQTGEILRLAGRHDEARQIYDTLLLVVKIEYSKNWVGSRIPDWFYQILAFHRIGHTEKTGMAITDADNALHDDGRFHFLLACIYAQTDQQENALAQLEYAVKAGWNPFPASWINGTAKDPFLDPLRHLPEFQAWEKRWSPPYKDYSKE